MPFIQWKKIPFNFNGNISWAYRLAIVYVSAEKWTHKFQFAIISLCSLECDRCQLLSIRSRLISVNTVRQMPLQWMMVLKWWWCTRSYSIITKPIPNKMQSTKNPVATELIASNRCTVCRLQFRLTTFSLTTSTVCVWVNYGWWWRETWEK